MDGNRFDAVVRRAAVASRRGVLGLALGGALNALGGTANAATCRKRCGPCKHCKHGHCKPKPDGSACGAGNVCAFGVCRLAGTCAGPKDYCTADNLCGPLVNDCRCFATIGGSSLCGITAITCGGAGCTSDSQCGVGQACVYAGCPGIPCPGNGYGCVQACPVKSFK